MKIMLEFKVISAKVWEHLHREQ